MTRPSDSIEEFESSLGSVDVKASITIADRTLTAPVKLIEYKMILIELMLESARGFGWIPFTGDESSGSLDVLVSNGTPVTVSWPAGYTPFEEPNNLVQELVDDPKRYGISDSGR